MNGNSEPASAHRAAPRWKRRLQNLALSATVFLLCFAGMEGVLRIAGYGNLEVYAPDARLYWRLRPNQRCYTKVGRRPVRVNAHGTRGAAFAPDKPAGTFRILSLGDSRTFGWGLAEDETYSARLQRMLQEALGPERRVEVINAGVNAWSYPQMLVYLRERGLAFHPDVVVLAEANLWTQFSGNASPGFVRAFLRRVWLKNLLRRSAIYHYVVEIKLRRYYERHRTRFIPVDPRQDDLFRAQQREDPDAVFRDAIERLCRLAQDNAVQPVLLHLPALDEWASTNRPPTLRAKRDVGARLGVPLVDVTPDIRPDGKDLYLEADPIHFNARGNEIVASRLFEAVRGLEKP